MTPHDLKKLPEFGSLAAVARVCEVTREAVRHWEKIPAKKCPLIEAKFPELTCEILRPDLTWNRDERGNVIEYCVAIKKET